MTSGSSTSTATLPRLGRRPWVMLALGFLAQTATSMLTSTPAFLIPQLHAHGVPLATAGLLASTTTIGMVIALVAWGALADRIGERWVLSGGLVLAAIAAAGAMLTSTNFVALSLFFVLGGIASASSSPASGRLVTGWFPKNRRGPAMGIRQGSQPLGVALAALVVPPLAANGIPAAALASVVFCGVIGVVGAIVLRDPARPEASAAPHLTANPYRSDSTLVRIHLVSILLVIPQFTISTFGFVWLVEAQHLPVPRAGAIVGLAQLIGAVGRIGVGVWSDRLGSRMRPLRWVALAAVASMLLLALVGLFFAPVIASILIIVAATITVADNGLAFGAVAEIAGPFWSGRALGAQNTGQWIGASLVGPLAGLLIGVAGYPITFVAAAVCALVAVPLVPSSGDREHGTPAPVNEGSGSR